VLLIVVLLLFASMAFGQVSRPNTCVPAGEGDRTSWVHDHLVINAEDKPIRNLRGTVRNVLNQPIQGVLVEIFPRKAGDPDPVHFNGNDSSGRRVEACVTDESGEFSFELGAGHYEVRGSKPDWNPTSMLVLVDRRRGSKKLLTVPLKVGD